MANIKPKADVVIVGMGWTGAIMAKELTDAGLHVVVLERGADRDTQPDFAYPKVVDELEGSVHRRYLQSLSQETVTARHNLTSTAVPYRQMGSFKPGTGVGGAGSHWSGCHFRALPEDFKLRSNTEQRYGAKFIPDDMTIQDFPVTYEDLEPHFDHFEYVCGTSGKAGVIQGAKQAGGNPFEGSRSREFPLGPNPNYLGAEMFYGAAREMGWDPYPIPASNASAPYVNPYGCQMGPCNACGFCSDYGCLNYSKASPNISILPVLRQRKNFELRTHAQVLKVNLDSDGKKATGVTYLDAQGREVEQQADLVLLCAFSLFNVHLMLLSGIGKPYDPVSGEGTIGRNYSYQNLNRVVLFFGKEVQANQFIGIGGAGTTMDNLNGNQDYLGAPARRRPGARDQRAAGHASLGHAVETGSQRCVPAFVLLRGARCLHVVPSALPEPGPNLQGRLRSTAAADELRLARQRDQGFAVPGRQSAGDVENPQPDRHGRRRQKAGRALQHHQVPEHPHLWGRDHGQRPENLGIEPLPAVVGRAQRVRYRRQCVPAK
jgi:gluconate 2-dehydrogenase alpha chain